MKNVGQEEVIMCTLILFYVQTVCSDFEIAPHYLCKLALLFVKVVLSLLVKLGHIIIYFTEIMKTFFF